MDTILSNLCRSTLPSYGFFIMNRLGIDNLMADLTADMALELTSDYIIYRDEKGEARNTWPSAKRDVKVDREELMPFPHVLFLRYSWNLGV